MKKFRKLFTTRVVEVLIFASLLSVGLLSVRIVAADELWLSFMAWNLFLAWLPLVFALSLRINLAKKPWRHWQNLLLTLLWLGFLPNSFYMMTDLIHLQSSGQVSVLYDAAMMMSFVLNGLILGYMSVYLVHVQLLERFKRNQAHAIIMLALLSCGFAIYLGRYLRWNTWDVLINPFGILFDLSERVVNPVVHSQTYVITFVYFMVIATTYGVVYELAGLLDNSTKK